MLAGRFRRLQMVLDRRQPDLTVLMERVNKPHNFSAILRNCDAVGVLEAHAVPAEGGLTLHHETSGGTSKWVRVHRHPEELVAIRTLQEAGHQVVAAHPDDDAIDFRKVDFTLPTAILLGAELEGVSAEARKAADLAVRIPMVGMAGSLNVSVAAALLLYEAFAQRESAGLYERSRLDPERRKRLLFEWAYPRLARALRKRGESYPALGQDGEILGSLEALRKEPPHQGSRR